MIVIGLVVLLSAALGGYVLAYKDKVYPHTYLAGENLAGQKSSAVKAKISQLAEKQQSGETEAIYKDKTVKLNFSDLELNYDQEKIFDQTFGLGRDKNFFVSLGEIIRAPFWKTKVKPAHTISDAKVSEWFFAVSATFDTPHTDTNLEVKNGQAKVLEPVAGLASDQEKLKKDLNNSIDNFKLDKISADLIKDEPKITVAQAEGLKTEAVQLVSKPLILKTDPVSKTFTVKPDTLGSWIKLKVKDNKVKSDEIYVSFDNDKIIEFLDDVATSANVDPIDAKFIFKDGKATVTGESKPGFELNRKTAAEQIIGVLEKLEPREITLKLETKQPAITSDLLANVAKLGIKELIGKGTTSFVGSPQNRRHNIATGTTALSGIILKPGEEFSTIGRLGNIDGSQGYLPELVIKGNKTVPEFGGGLCQVSTTLFRAVMNTGLKVTDRTNHAYRVAYYEPPVGMDATIYSPKPDFKFINNTDSYILMQGSISGNNLTFEFYGTKDGRQVTISDPVVTDIIPPGAPIEVVDPGMEPGSRKQVESAHPGAKAYFDYKVTRAGQTLQEIRFKSSFVPWTARFIVGPPKPEEPKPAEPAPTPAPAETPAPAPAPTT